MKYKLFKDISFNTLQVLVNQFLGVFIFLLISRYLDKPAFGELSWSLAVLTFLLTILSLRLEQVIVRNVAAGGEPSKMLSLFMVHNLVAGTGFFLLLSIGAWWLPQFFNRHSLLWILSISQLLSFFSLPFKQVITGRGAFGWLAILSVTANLIRAAGLLGVLVFSSMSLQWVLILFTFSALAEFLTGAFIVFGRMHIPFTARKFSEYKDLIKSSLPQAGVVVLNAGIARMDWILLGVFSTPVRTAEYSFAYKAFELSPLPLLIIAPMLLNRYARSPMQIVPGRLDLLIRWEMVLATFLPLLSIIAWSPLADALTHNKYGQVNAVTFLILCFCIPLQYLINIHWSREFAQDRLGRIFRITAITALVILAGDLILIPLYAGPGAAIAFLAGMIVQYLLYCQTLSPAAAMDWGRSLLIPVAVAVCSGLTAVWMTTTLVPRLLIASCSYILLISVTGRFRLRDWSLLKDWILGKKERPSVRVNMGRGGWNYIRQVDWGLLFFLILILDVKLIVKIAAVMLAIFLHRKQLHSWKIISQGWTRFYAAMLLLASLNLLLHFRDSLSAPALLSFGLGCGYWLLSLAAAWQMMLFVREGDRERLHHTVSLFFLLHVICMLTAFLVVCIRSGSFNPYTYQGQHQKYFINTGDFITGISFDSSVTAAIISAFGLLYFLYRGKRFLSLLCMVTVLLAGSNLVNLLLGGVFVFVFIFHTDKLQKSMILVYVLMLIVFLGKVSPQNMDYAEQLALKLGHDKDLAGTEIVNGYPGGHKAYPIDGKDYTGIKTNHPMIGWREIDFMPGEELIKREYELTHFKDSIYPAAMQDSLNRKYIGSGRPGRLIAWQELWDFFREHPARLPLGAGMGNFSSRLAFKTTALNIGGMYPQSMRYVHPYFRDHYLYLYLYYYTRDQRGHSVVNLPDSVYGQLLAEYGLAGLLVFGFFYAGYFGRKVRSLSYGLPLLVILGAAFFTEYWFEQLSIVVLFEFLLLLDRPMAEKKYNN